MKTYTEWLALGEDRWSIREALRADVKTLQNVYRETREEGPAATVAAFVAAVGYSRAVAVVGTLVNRHAWDGRISRSVAAWAAALPDTWDEEAAQHFSVYVDDVIHLAHFDQIAREMKKTTPPEDDDKRPETISADTVPETPETISAGSQAQEAAQEAPETISDAAAQVEQEAAPVPVPEAVALAPETFRAVVESAPRCGLLLDIQPGAVQYRTEDGKARCIYTDAVTVEYGGNMARIKYHNRGNRGQITLDKKHDCFPVAAVAAGTVSPSDALWDIVAKLATDRSVTEKDAAYFKYTAKPSGSRKKELAETMKYTAKLADLAACIIKHAADGIPLFIHQIAEDLEAVAAVGKEYGQGLTAAKHAEAVAAWIRETLAACTKAAQEAPAVERPETISAGNPAPEAAQEDDENTVILVETTFDLVNGGRSSRRIQYNAKTGETETIPEKKPEALRKFAAYYEDFPYTARIFPAKNKKEAEAEARKYRRAWQLPALLRVEALSEEEAAKLEAEQAARWNIPKPEEAAPAPAVAQEAPAALPAPEKAPEAAQEVPAPDPVPERPETISAGSPAPEKKPEARPARQAPPKPARGSGRPLDCIGQILSGNGWQIVFDGSLQRTRVIIEEAAREKAAPLAEAAGFYYSVNTDSWHKKLTQKAKRAAEALAEQLRAAC